MKPDYIILHQKERTTQNLLDALKETFLTKDMTTNRCQQQFAAIKYAVLRKISLHICILK